MELAIKRFDFGGLQDFSAPPKFEIANDHTLPKEAVEDTPPPPPSFSEGELEAAKKLAYEEGKAEGIKREAERQEEERKGLEAATLKSVEALCAQAANLPQEQTAFNARQTSELSGLLRLLVQKIAGDALAEVPERAILAMIDDCLGVLQNQPKINLLVHPSCFKPIENKLRDIVVLHHLENIITLKENADLHAGDARIDWGTGHADRDMNALWQQVEEMINSIDFSTLAQPQTEQESHQGEDNE